MPRPVTEWIGKHDGVNIPPRVRLRVYDRYNGVCHICRQPIKPQESWQADHIKALANGGEHRETNLAPVHSHCHVGKTARDVAEKSKVAKVRKKHLGIKPVKKQIRSAGFAKAERTPKPPLPELPRKQFYEAKT